MLQLSLKKIILLLVGLFLLTGCSASYTITIDNTSVKENISVLDNVSNTRSVSDVMDNYKKKYFVYSTDDLIDDYMMYNYIDGLEYYTQTYNIDNDGYHLYYDYTYPIEKYANANSINYSYNYKEITYKNNKLSIKTTSPNNYLRYTDIFDNLVVNIVTDYLVEENNADDVVGNRYIWYFDKQSNYEKRINFVVNLSKKASDNKDNTTSIDNDKNNLIIIICIFILYLIITIYFIIRKRKKGDNQ